ncbi:O-antigen ligase family protein [Gluconacetobacter takamatsuzukensis]|uniref:O-antigen ligase family protein n=2 Tax=Gluconacetobacter takamatsuzukensis TaxID=1286190 RepID=A0A7W4KG79_9PROT|nr:O-antigen ligase family protein [Gluconacetobacter takamatsuzukensis]
MMVETVRGRPGLPDHVMRWIAVAMTLMLPFFLLRGRAISDGFMSCIGVLFLLHCLRARDRGWWRGWPVFALAFWALAILSSVMHGTGHAVAEALVLGRFLLFCAALECWVLRDGAARRWLGLSVTLAALWLVVECWQQYLLGTNLWGYPRWVDGALTGPFYKPRAGAALLMVVFPGLMVFATRWLEAPAWRPRLAGVGLIMFLVLTMILIGQRMPALLFGLGLGIMAVLIRRLRWPVLAAGLVGVAGLALLPVLSPPAYAKLVVRFMDQMRHFSDSPYGQIYIRAGVMLDRHPWLGLGVDGFRNACADPAYVRDLVLFGHTFPSRGVAVGCNIHPHNIYLDVATTAGLAGLACFVAMVACWLWRMVRALSPARAPQQAMLCVTSCVMLWPVASSSALFTVRTAGWIFLMVGWGLAASADIAGEKRAERRF